VCVLGKDTGDTQEQKVDSDKQTENRKEQRGKSEHQTEAQKKRNSSEPNAGLIAGLLVLAIVVGTLLGLLLYCLKRNWKLKAACKHPLPANPVTPGAVMVIPAKAPPSCPTPETRTKSCQTFDYSFYVMKFGRRTPVGCLRRDYEDRLKPNCHYAMKSEFGRIPRGPTDAADEGRSPHNVALNRSQEVRDVSIIEISTLCLRKKQDTKLLPITSPNGNRFSKFFHW